MAITTGKVRASYVHIFQPRVIKDEDGKEGEPKYSVTILIPKTDITTINAIFAEIEKAKQEGVQRTFGGTMPPICRIPIHDGDGTRPVSGEPFGEECRGHMVMSATSKQKPVIVDLDRNEIINPAEIYSGCYIRANINFFPYKRRGNSGISCGLNAVQKIEDGDPLTARVTAEEAFGGANIYTAAPGMTAPAAYQQPTQAAAPGYPGVGTGYGPMSGAVMQPNMTPYVQPNMTPYVQPNMTPYVQPQQQIDPITGRPMLAGGVMGLQ